VTTTQPVNGVAAQPSLGSRHHRRGFWVVAFAFLCVMALGTVPSPLYGLYRARDHFSLFMVTHEEMGRFFTVALSTFWAFARE
jgi:hypothetical protein